MKALNYLRSISLIFGGSLLLLTGCERKKTTIIRQPDIRNIEIVHNRGKIDTIRGHIVYDEMIPMVKVYNEEFELIKLYYNVESVKDLDKE